MISIPRKKPKLSLDDLVNDLIEDPTPDDIKVIGDVRADDTRSTKVIKGLSDLMELNAWIDAHNRRPNFDSDDFKESQFARRMNGYALHSIEHEDLKPYDKHGLIDQELYQSPAPKASMFEDDIPAAIPFELGKMDDLVAIDTTEVVVTANTDDADDSGRLADDFINGMSLEDMAWIDSISVDEAPVSLSPASLDAKEFLDLDIAEPLSSISKPSASVSEAAAAIIRLRAEKKALVDRQALEADIDSALKARNTSEVGTDIEASPKSDVPSFDSALVELAISSEPIQSQPQTAVAQSSVTVTVESDESDIVVEVEEAAVDHKDINLPAGGIDPAITEFYARTRTTYNIQAPETSKQGIPLAFMSINYQATPNALSYADITYVKKYTPYVFDEVVLDEAQADDIDEIFTVLTEIPSVEQLPANYHDNLIDHYAIHGITEDELLAGEVEPELAGNASSTPVELPAATASNPALPPVATPSKTEVYWSIDGEYDETIVNSDYARGYVQRHNPEPPMTATDKQPNRSIQPTLSESSDSVVATPPKSVSPKPSTKTSGSTTPRQAPIKPQATASLFDDDPIMSDLEDFLSEAIVAGKTEGASENFESLDDILADDDDFLSSLCFEEDHLFDTDNKYTEITSKATPDEVGKQKPCDDFFMYESHFNNLHTMLESGELKTVRYRATDMKVGDAFILNGLVGFIQSIGEYRENFAGEYDPRLRLIFDNGTESNILLLTLGKNLYADNLGRLIVRSSDDFTDFDTPSDSNAPAKLKTGQVYIVRSLSDDPIIKRIPNLYKIGFTKKSVQDRIKNATSASTFLEAPIEVIEVANCYDLDPRGLEGLIHNFLSAQQISITLTSKTGGTYRPKEWFSVELGTAREIIRRITDGSIVDYRMDNTTNRIVRK